MECEKYHQIIPDTLKKKIGNFLFGVYNIEFVEYVPEEQPQNPFHYPRGSEGEML